MVLSDDSLNDLANTTSRFFDCNVLMVGIIQDVNDAAFWANVPFNDNMYRLSIIQAHG